jgi:2-polyprenyl-3-methyl-5-hydroxy-6-metoxy-1,4-benzoquinol methylase
MIDSQVKCRACGSDAMKTIWVGKSRVGNLGEYSSGDSVAVKCTQCNSVFMHSAESYDVNNFKQGKYRGDVDGVASDKAQAYFHKHLSCTLSYLQKVDPEMICGENILDFGCGAGVLLRMLANYAGRVVGIELDESFHLQEGNVSIVSGFQEATDICKDFDTITCFSTIGHLDNVEEVLAGFKKVLAPGGTIILGMVNPEDILLNAALSSYATIFFRDNYRSFYSNLGLKTLMEKHGLQHYRTDFEQRYGWDNFLGHLGVDRKLKSNIDNSMYQSLVEEYGISDYLYMFFRHEV